MKKMKCCCAIKGGNVLLVSLASAVVLFVWMSLSWGALSWHQDSMHGFDNPWLMRKMIQQQAPRSGLYALPYVSRATKDNASQWQAAVSAYRSGPLMFCSIQLAGHPGSGDLNMNREMGWQFLLFFVSSLLVCLLLGKASPMPCCKRICFVTLFGFTVAILAHFPKAIWLFYPLQAVLVQVADTTLGWFLASWVIAKCLRLKQ